MSELDMLVNRARGGDLDAFGAIVGRFQDMALGYAYSILGDFGLAEDVAQEAFMQAYRDLAALREPQAFPGWFRKIVFKHCDRIKRVRKLATVPLDSVSEVPSREPGPAEYAEAREMREAVLGAISSLPPAERAVTTLFYINGYTQKDVAEFLELPVTTVNNRLHAARTRLKERMVQMVDDQLKSHALPRDFPERIRQLLELPRPMTIDGHPVRELWLAFRSCFADFEEVELDEVCERQEPIVTHFGEETIYAVNDRLILRPELTSLLVDHWISHGGETCQLVSAGRVFRAGAGDANSKTRLHVFHQAEVLWVGKDLHMNALDETVRRVAHRLAPEVEFRSKEAGAYPLASAVRTYEIRWRDRWVGVAGGAAFRPECLIKASLDPSHYSALGFAFGLERCAQIVYGLDDVRDLWQPPYVP